MTRQLASGFFYHVRTEDDQVGWVLVEERDSFRPVYITAHSPISSDSSPAIGKRSVIRPCGAMSTIPRSALS